LLVEDFLFSAGAVAGHAIKKVMKIAAVVVGLFVAGLAFLAYKGWIDVKWTAMEISTSSTLENVTTKLMHTVTDTASQISTHSPTIASSRLTLAAGIGFVPRLMFGFKKG
jgi:uncharacterized membrane protein (Fun14 family)